MPKKLAKKIEPKAWRYSLLVLMVAVFCVGTVLMATVGFLSESPSPYAVPEDEFSAEFDRFPVSVNPIAKEITEDPLIDWYVRQHLSLDIDAMRRHRLKERLFSQFAVLPYLQQLAAPLSRTLVIYPGERQEEFVGEFGDILRWSQAERARFASLVVTAEPTLSEGKFYPGKYVVERGTSPEKMADIILSKFRTEVLERYDAQVEAMVPLTDALTIASLLEREAYDFDDMRYISGIIWNRLFIGMPLQLDATLQYARGSLAAETKWWPAVRPEDKFIDSEFNTYAETGLPPAPIANPSLESIIAALNPRETDCLFYFHDEDGNFYCTTDYEAHKALLRDVYNLP